MKKGIFLLFALICYDQLFGQNTFKAVIKDSETMVPLVGASALLKGTGNGTIADHNGLILLNGIPAGRHIIIFSFIGYEESSFSVQFPVADTTIVEVLLHPDHEELEEVIITATRSSRTIEDIPTRVEAISGEEIEEKGNMKPGDIRMMLNESTGIQTQQTSATSYNSSIRIQGLDGKYTQILRDGYPLYTGFSGGLGLLQIVPLDLKQVEVIKGASSTLYGGGAIAGLVNLVSRTPGEERELDFLINGTSALGLDISGYFSNRFKKFSKIGTTAFGSYHLGTPYDPAGIGLTAIPKFSRLVQNRKLYIYLNPRTTIEIGLNTTFENRTGGDIEYIKGRRDSIHSYFEENKTSRLSSQIGLNHQFNDSIQLNFKNSFGYYKRKIEIPDYVFSGLQFSSFSEATFLIRKSGTEWIAGLNFITENFKQNRIDSALALDYHHVVLGAFIQNLWNISDVFSLETGLRGDYQNHYGFFLLPRVSGLFRINDKLSFRIGAGLGYKTPTVFTEDAERLQFKKVLPIQKATEAEQSWGGNIDFNYQTLLFENITFSMNMLYFYTKISKPIILTPVENDFHEFRQSDGFIDTKGIETNIKFTYNQFKLFIGYTLSDVHQHENGQSAIFPLVAKHRLNNVLMYEIHEKLKIGLEAYYFSKQLLNDDTIGRSYWINGIMVEKLWRQFSVFINFENIFDTRQTKFHSIYSGTISNPEFRDIYAPVDGFVVNGGFKLRL